MATYYSCPRCGRDITTELSGWERVSHCPKCGLELDTKSAQRGARTQGAIGGVLFVGVAAGFIGQSMFFETKLDHDPTPALVIGLSTAAVFLMSYFVSYKFAGKPAGHAGCAVMAVMVLTVVVGIVIEVFR